MIRKHKGECAMKLISTALLAAGFVSLAACGGGAANNAAANNSAGEPLPPVEEPNASEPVANEPLPPPAEPGNGSNEAAGNSAGNVQ
jgi:hypothetical protein